VIRLSIPPLPSRQDLRRDGPALPPLLLSLLRDLPRLLLLLLGVIEYRGAVLRAGIHALAVLRGRVVHLVEELEEGAVGELRGIEGHLQRLGVSSPARAHGAVAWVLAVATDVSDAGVQKPFPVKVFPEQMFHAPEAASRDCALLRIGREVLSGGFRV